MSRNATVLDVGRSSGEPADGLTRRAGRWTLSKWDGILLPLVFLGTIVVMLVGGEITARLLYPESNDREPCEFSTAAGLRYHPFCTSHSKVWEGPWITQHFNDCGYRTAESCKPRPAGSLRVAVMGSSTARGALVNYPESFAARASETLSSLCGGLVDFQNLGTEPVDVDQIDQRIPEALALKPAAIVMTVGTFDLVHLKDPPPGLAHPEPPPAFNLHSVVNLLRDSRLFLLMQYYLYRDPAFQIRSFLLNGDASDYVRAPLSPAWRQRIANFGDLLTRITRRTDPAGVPVLLVYVPGRAEAAMATRRYPLPGNVDPLVLPDALQAMAARHGVRFVDPTPRFAAAADFRSLFYLSDGHAREGGHAMIAKTVEHGLLAEPAFSACRKEPGS